MSDFFLLCKSNNFKGNSNGLKQLVAECMQKREPFLGQLPEEFLMGRGGWNFHNVEVWL